MKAMRIAAVVCISLPCFFAPLPAVPDARGALPRVEYVVAADKSALSGEWRSVVDALAKKHRAKTVRFDGVRGLPGILPEIRRIRPKYVCFVAKPEVVGRDFVVAASRVLRHIDDDPYGDAIWGIVTGYRARDALNVVRAPLSRKVRSIATSMGGDGTLDGWESGFASDERSAGNFWIKRRGGACVKIRTGGNVAKAYADAFNSMPVDYFMTSGHASERNWQIIYNKNDGMLEHTDKAGLRFVESGGARHDLKRASLKVYLGAGNCLIGHVDSPACMATAWIHAAGVEQFAGYTVPSWYGFMGWGVAWLYSKGRYSLPEARYLENQRAIWALSGEPSPLDRKGLAYDRDTFAFYGDPCQRIVFPVDAMPYTVKIDGGRVKVDFVKDCEFPPSSDVKNARPIMALLDKTPPGDAIFDEKGRIVPGAVSTERFVFIPAPGIHKRGESLVFQIGKSHRQSERLAHRSGTVP